MSKNFIHVLGGKYIISENGNVYNAKTTRRLKPSKGVITLYDTDKVKTCIRHNRLIAELFVDNPTNSRFVIHLDGNLENCAASNLKWDDRYNKSQGCLVFFDNTGIPLLYKSYADFLNKTGYKVSTSQITRLVKGEIENIGEHYSKSYIENQIKNIFTSKDIMKAYKGD